MLRRSHVPTDFSSLYGIHSSNSSGNSVGKYDKSHRYKNITAHSWLVFIVPLVFALVGFSGLVYVIVHMDDSEKGAHPHLPRALHAQSSLKQSLNVKNFPNVLRAVSSRVSSAVLDHLFVAGVPKYSRVFARDSIMSAVITNNQIELRSILELAIALQGKTSDPQSGEEHGKCFHEFPHVTMRGLSTMYSASDTTAWFVIGVSHWLRAAATTSNSKSVCGKWSTHERQFINSFKAPMARSYAYIRRHINDQWLFSESPTFLGENGRDFALKVTYWKDSELLGRVHGQPAYPVVYTALHTLYIRAVREYGWFVKCVDGDTAFDASGVNTLSARMVEALMSELSDPSTVFVLGKDKQGVLDSGHVNSDMFSVLYFLDKPDVSESIAHRIEQAAKVLETPIGFATSLPMGAKDIGAIDSYHQHSVWPIEMSMVYDAGLKWKSPYLRKVTMRVLSSLNGLRDLGQAPEYFEMTSEGKWSSSGCTTQLWSLASHRHLTNVYINSRRMLTKQNGTHAAAAAAVDGDSKKSRPFCADNNWWIVRGVASANIEEYCLVETKKKLMPPLDPQLVKNRVRQAVSVHYPPNAQKRGIVSSLLHGRSLDVPHSSSPSGFTFTCRDSSATIPVEFVNDDFCDCSDGSDEPGTSACAGLPGVPNRRFVCGRVTSLDVSPAHRGSIPSSMVDDGVCDCCDGSDEVLPCERSVPRQQCH